MPGPNTPAVNPPVPNNPFSQNRLTFVSHVAGGTGLDPGVVLAWTCAEMGPTFVNGNLVGNQNWLAVGLNGSQQRAPSPVWNDPVQAGDATAAYIKGTAIGGWTSNPTFGTILSTVGKSPQAQMAAIDHSGWVGAGVGYNGNLQACYASYHQFAPGASATVGGIAGLGGTGSTLNTASTSPFHVGDTANPDEDYFTAINRLCQSAYWYCFSDGEILYVADGTMLMQQPPARVINRFAPEVLHLDLTYDNTAYQYAHHHKRRGRIQRKTQLAKVSSPVEAIVQLICEIDEIRAGDVVWLLGTGPGDGPWLVGNCTRSVFAVYSQLTLVPPVNPINAAPSSPTAAGATGTGTISSRTPTGSLGMLASPFTKKYTADISNVDMGVDFGRQQGISTGDPILAIADCYLRRVDPNWYANQPTMFFEFVDKSAGYWGWYVGEEINMNVSVGPALIKQGTVVATYAASGTGIEIGFAASDTQTQSQADGDAGSRHGGSGTKAGNAFLLFLQRAGAV